MTLSPLAQQLTEFKIIPVIVIENVADALKLGQLLTDCNLPIAEVTFRTAAAKEAIKALKEAYPSLIVGAGTVLNPKQADDAREAGADFIVSPGFNVQTVQACRSLDVPIIPGINNPTAIEMALNEGITEVKFFPAEPSGGVPMLKALLAPYKDIVIMPTGGINQNNVKDYLAVERIIACGLSWMVDPKLIKAGDWATIESRILEINKIVA